MGAKFGILPKHRDSSYFIRGACIKYWYYRVSNTEVLTRMNINPVEVIIRASRLQLFGHVSSMPGEKVPKYLMKWAPKHGKRSRGRPRTNWLSCVLEDAAVFTGTENITLEEAKQQASDRGALRSLIRRNKEFLCGAGHSND